MLKSLNLTFGNRMKFGNLAIITARGGSKRIPRKNIKEFFGKPMLFYAINAAFESGIFDEIMVSTDDDEIAQIARNLGAKVPFMRSAKTADDFATTADVLKEVVSKYQEMGFEIGQICCIYPCVPFLSGDLLKKAYEKLVNSNANALTPVVRYSFPIQRAFVVDKDGFLQFREPQNAPKRSQDLEPTYHDAGAFYFFKFSDLRSDKKIAYEIDEIFAQDIDTIDDWKMAEMKYEIMQKGLK